MANGDRALVHFTVFVSTSIEYLAIRLTYADCAYVVFRLFKEVRFKVRRFYERFEPVHVSQYRDEMSTILHFRFRLFCLFSVKESSVSIKFVSKLYCS